MDVRQNNLVDFVSSLSGGDGFRVEESLGSGYVRLRVAEAERRQAKHDIRCVEDAVIELLRNSRDAGASRIFVALSREGDMRTVTIVDDGSGIPEHMQERVFDARVTSKLDTMSMDRWGVHGRGMALYSIRQNAIEARVTRSGVGMGTVMRTVFDVNAVKERADQSTWPTVARTSGKYEVRGPRNILRACVEFALECGRSCNVYVGSPSEVVSSLRVRLEPTEDLVACAPSRALDARELKSSAEDLGFEMSERTAHRIIRGEIAPLRNVYALVTTARQGGSGRCSSNVRKLSLSDADRREFVEALERAFGCVGDKYYLTLASQPRIRVANGLITATFEYMDES